MVTELFRRVLAPTSPEPLGLVIDRARGTRVTTTDGREYLDLTAGIGVANVGHGREEIARAVRDQLERHAHVMVYGEYEQSVQTELAAAIVDRLPDSLEQIFLTCTGTEAIEGALKTARKATGRSRFVAFEGGYHGDTMGALSLMSSERYRGPFEPLVRPVVYLPFDDTSALDDIDEQTAAVVVEPIQGEGGIRVPGEEFLRALRDRCDATGAFLVFDEVITGFGRTGREFAMQHGDVVPDIVCLAKAMGGGLPLGGFAASSRVLRAISVDPPLCHVTTFGGNPVSCAAGLAALRILIDERLAERAARVGAYFADGLATLIGHGGVEEVRGRGLMLGLRLESAAATRRFVERSLAERLLLGWTLHCDDLVRITPPLVLGEADVDEALDRMRAALR